MMTAPEGILEVKTAKMPNQRQYIEHQTWTPSQVPQPTCFWKLVGRTNSWKTGISTLNVIFSAKKIWPAKMKYNWTQLWVNYRFRPLRKNSFTHLVSAAPWLPSPRIATLLPQLGHVCQTTFSSLYPTRLFKSGGDPANATLLLLEKTDFLSRSKY